MPARRNREAEDRSGSESAERSAKVECLLARGQLSKAVILLSVRRCPRVSPINDFDTLQGGGGADLLRGGAGADDFVYRSPSEGGDVIRDFPAGRDKICVSGKGFCGDLARTGLEPGQSVAHSSGPAAAGFAQFTCERAMAGSGGTQTALGRVHRSSC